MPRERSITDSILKYLNGLPETVAEKVFGNAQQKGRPDVNGCNRKRSFRIEVKTPDHGNQPTPLQEMNLKQWARTGALCFTAYSLKDVKAMINEEGVKHLEDFHGVWYKKNGQILDKNKAVEAPKTSV